jgi:hypothetical protein
MSKNPRPRKGDARHVRLYSYMTRTPAWKSLNGNDRATYVLLAERFMGTNNGKIPLSVRQVAVELRISPMTARRCLATLQERGFIVATRKGAFSLKRRHATEWRMTEHPDSVSGHGPSGEYREWRPEPEIQNTVPVVIPIGASGDTGVAEKTRHGAAGDTVDGQKFISRYHHRHTLSYQVPLAMDPAVDPAVDPASAPPDGSVSASRTTRPDTRHAEPKGGKLPWSTPTVTEATDPDEVVRPASAAAALRNR